MSQDHRWVMFTGCAAVHTEITHRKFDVQSRISSSIFLYSVGPALKAVFVQVRNTSDKSMPEIAEYITGKLQLDGYAVETDPDKAHYLLQANVLYVGAAKASAADQTLQNGYGGALRGGLVGAGIGSNSGGTGTAIGVGVGVLAGGLIEAAANSLVKDVTYTAVTDVQISERTADAVTQNFKSQVQQGSSTAMTQTVQSTVHYKRYRTRVVSTADKVNLKFADAVNSLEKSLGASVGGIF